VSLLVSGSGKDQAEAIMTRPKHMDIVRRAYELWQEAGQPAGKDQEFYHQAEEELRNKDKPPPAEERRSI
jgi:hypothetical protein